MLSLRAVNHYYGSQHTLWNVDLELWPGKCTCVMGRQGMGKPRWCYYRASAGRQRQYDWQDAGAAPYDLMPLRPVAQRYRYRVRPAG